MITRSRLWSILTIVILTSLHLKVATIGGFDLSLAFVLIPVWVYYSYRISPFLFTRQELILVLLMFILPFIPGNISSWSEFIKTYAQFAISYFLLIRTIYRPFRYNEKQIDDTLFCFQIILITTVALQYVLVDLLKQYQFYNLWGEFQLHYELRVIESKLRMKAFYLEPSYLGFVTINLFWIRQHLNKKQIVNSNVLLSILIIIFAKSAFAFISLFVLILYELYFEKNLKLLKKYKTVIYAGIPLLLVLFSSQLFSLFRLNELSAEPGQTTSGYMRLILPFLIVIKILITDKHFLGLSFGQLDLYLKQFSIGGYHEGAINNAFFSIIAYWGIIAIGIYIFVAYYFFKYDNKLVKSYIILTFLNLNNSGAFVTTQYVFIAFLLPLLVLKINKSKKTSIKQDDDINYNSNEK